MDIPEIDISGLKTNLELSSIIELTDDYGNIVQDGRDASGLNLKVGTNIADIDSLELKVGSDDIEPKTGTFNRLYTIENGSNIKPEYYSVKDYYVLLERAFPNSIPIIYEEKLAPDPLNERQYITIWDAKVNPKTILIDSANKTLNDILVENLEQTDINKKNITFFTKKMTEMVFGNSSTVAIATPLSSINFNTRSLGSIGMDVEFIRKSAPIETLEDLAVQFNQTLETIASNFLIPVSTLTSVIPGGFGEIEIADIIDGLLEPAHPVEWLENMILTKVMVNANGNLIVKNYSYQNASQENNNVLTNEFSAPFLNVHQYLTKDKDLVDIYHLDSESLELIENSSLDSKKKRYAV